MKKQIIISALVLLFILIRTVLVIIYGKGYQLGIDPSGRPGILGTGLLVTTSVPDGAEVYVNDHLTTATNNTINLSPGEYKIRIVKDGYFPWEKKIKIEKEIVSKAEALLFPTAPKLENITLTGVTHAVIDSTFSKIAYTVGSESAKKNNGIYILDMNGGSILTLQGGTHQIISDNNTDNFSDAEISWSPNSESIIATISANRNTPTTYLLNANNNNDSPQDITETLHTYDMQWTREKEQKDKVKLDSLKPKLQKTIADNFNIVSWSPDEKKIIYQATQSAVLDQIIVSSNITSNSTPETRNIEKDNIYIYDIKEDKNYLIEKGDKKIDIDYQLTWFPDSTHILYVYDHKINIMEYDAQNLTTIYAGPFEKGFVYPWPNGSKVVILTNLNNPDIPFHLYTVSLN